MTTLLIHKNQPLDKIQWPVNVDTVVFKDMMFDSSIDHINWPSTIKNIRLGYSFNQPINLVNWPPELQILIFGVDFNQPIEQINWPQKLQTMIFGNRFNQPINKIIWPKDLKHLAFGEDFDQHVSHIKWPIFSVVNIRNDIIYDGSKIINKFDNLIKKKKSTNKNLKLTKPDLWTQWQRLCYKSKDEFNQQDLLALQTYAETLQIPNYEQLTTRQLCSQLAINLEQFQKQSKWTQKCQTETNLEGDEWNTINQDDVIQDDNGYCFTYSELQQLKKTPKHPYTNANWNQVTVKKQPILDIIKTHVNPQESVHKMISTHVQSVSSILIDELVDLINFSHINSSTKYFNPSALSQYEFHPQKRQQILTGLKEFSEGIHDTTSIELIQSHLQSTLTFIEWLRTLLSYFKSLPKDYQDSAKFLLIELTKL